MKYFFYVVLTTFYLHFGLISCKTDPTDIPVKVEIERFDQKLMAVKSKAELAGLFAKNPNYTKSLYRAMPDDSALITHVFYLTSHPDTRKFHTETEKNFGDLAKIKAQFKTAFQHIKSMYPTFKEPKIMITFTGLENDLFVSDSLIIISLEAFNGPKATYRPDQPNYLLRRYTPEHIVPMAVRYLSNSYNKTDQGDQTFLGDMIYFGKSLEFTKQMMPDTPDSLIIGYTGKELENTWAAQDLIWAHTVEKTLLYNKNPGIKEKYLGERPIVSEIGPACPGRIGQWLGWRIVERYMNENPKLTFQEVMKESKSEDILRMSAYRGQVEDKK
jgi:hypothetical protein